MPHSLKRPPCAQLDLDWTRPLSPSYQILSSILFCQVQLISIHSSNPGPEVQIVEAFALPEGDPVYEVAVRGSGWQKEVQEIRAVSAPASSETEIQVSLS